MNTKSKQLNIAKYLSQKLQNHGVEHTFGDGNIEGLKAISSKSDQDTVSMADIYGRIRGLSVAFVKDLNNVPVNQLFMTGSPVLLINELQETLNLENAVQGNEVMQDFDSQGKKRGGHITQSVRVHPSFIPCESKDYVNSLPSTLFSRLTEEHIDRLIERCFKEKRPVLLHDILPKEKNKVTDSEALKESIQEVRKLLREAEQPVILVGHEIQRHGLHEAVIHFAEKYHIPIAASSLGKSAVSEYHPLYMGIYPGLRTEVNTYMESSDLAFILGVTEKGYKFKQSITANYQSIQVNHHQYSSVHFYDFLRALDQFETNIKFRGDYPALIDVKTPHFEPSDHLTYQNLIACIQKHIHRDHIILSDLTPTPDLLLHEGSYYTAGQPTAAALAAPKKRVISITKNPVTVTAGDPITIMIGNSGSQTEDEFEKAFKNALEKRGIPSLIKVKL